MRTRLVFLLALSLFLTSALFAQTTSNYNEDWYPFVIPEKLDPDSPVNIGKLVLDPPAGKHGFCKVKDGHFYFEDGTRAKFWGTNLCFSACFPPHDQAKIIAERIAFFGFNAVRLHHMDYFSAPQGIFNDTSNSASNPNTKLAMTLSREQLDKLDYFIYQLKIHGIYVDINLLVGRHFTAADGVIDASTLGVAAKPASMFDRTLIDLQKKYAQDLLTHFNPYTKLKYCDEPSIALLEIINETSIEISGIKLLSNYYLHELEKIKSLLYDKDTKTDNDSFTNIEKNYFKEMTDYLRNQLNIKIPITGSQYSSLAAQESCDFIDKHLYWDHPQFRSGAWDSKNFYLHQQSLLTDENLKKFSELIKPKSNEKPITITEWNQCYPNKHSFEAPLLFSSLGLKYRYDGLFQYSYSEYIGFYKKGDRIWNFFDIVGNPQQLSLCSLASYLFLNTQNCDIQIEQGIMKINSSKIQGISGSIKNRTITSADFEALTDKNCSIFIFTPNEPSDKGTKMILLIVGNIKNQSSNFNQTTKEFEWGESPVLLEKVNATITINLNKKKAEIYELTQEGKRGKRIKSILTANGLSFSTNNSFSPWFEIYSE
jgi:hypothetical protein